MMMDWIRMEDRMRMVLREYYDKQFSDGVELSDAAQALDSISNILGTETGRGYPLEDAIRRGEKK